MYVEISKRWVEALESGDYRQTSGTLGTDYGDGTGEGYCCLGVLSELAHKDGVIEKHREDARLTYGPLGEEAELPHEVRQWAGTNQADPYLSVPPHLQHKAEGLSRVTAAGLNDGYGFSFSEIAECVRNTFGPVAA